MAEKPVLVGAKGELGQIILQNNLGKVSKPSNVDDLYKNLLEMQNIDYSIDNKDLITYNHFCIINK